MVLIGYARTCAWEQKQLAGDPWLRQPPWVRSIEDQGRNLTSFFRASGHPFLDEIPTDDRPGGLDISWHPRGRSGALPMPGQRRALELLDSDEDPVLVVTALDRLSYFVSDLELLLPGRRHKDRPVPSVLSLNEDVGTEARLGTSGLADFLDGAAAQRSRRRRKRTLFRPSYKTRKRPSEASFSARRAGLLAGAIWEGTAHLGRAKDSAERRTLLNQPRGRPAVAARSELTGRVLRMRASGVSLGKIAEALNEEDIPTTRGAKIWRASALQRLCDEIAPRPLDCKPEDDLPL